MWITGGELEEHHGRITMSDKINTCQPKTVEDTAEFFSTFRQPNGSSACFPAPVQNDAPGLAERANLSSIDEFKVLENRYED